MSQVRIPRVEVSIPEEDEDSDSGGSDQIESVSMGRGRRRRPSRISFSKFWRSVDPSPRVSTIDGPVSALGNVDTYYRTVRIRRNKLKLCCCSFSLVCIIAFIMTVLTIFYATKTIDIQYCTGSDSDHVTPRDLDDPDVFDDLTMEEYRAVTRYLLDYHYLELVPYENATLTDNYIFLIELYLPNKEETLQYLDEQSKQPERKAKTIIYRGNKIPPVVEEYLVFPLSSPNEAVYYKDPSYKRHPIPYNSRPVDAKERQCLYDTVIDIGMEELYPLLQKSYNLSYHNCTRNKDCIEVRIAAPFLQKSGDRLSWIATYQPVDEITLHPLGLRLLVRHEGTNTSEWTIEAIIYNGKSFSNTTVLMDSFWAETLVLSYVPTSKQIKLTINNHNDSKFKPGPFLFEPKGKRFSVIGQRIMYRTWTFIYHMRPSAGLMLFDINFNDVRIAYEISLQEVLVSYVGYMPPGFNSTSFATSSLFGSSISELVRGVDCPENAIFLSSDLWTTTGKIKSIKNHICVFENNGATPLQRHYTTDNNGQFTSYTGINNYHLIIRSVVNIDSSDYIMDYIFHTNGVIEAKMSMSGQIHGAFRLRGDEKYGSVIGDSTVANIYTHIVNFKVDLDIAGVENRFTTLSVGVKDGNSVPADSNENRLHLVTESKENERELVKFNYENPQHYIIHNTKAKDTFHSSRAYRINNKSPYHALQDNIWTKTMKELVQHPIIITNRKDTEQTSASLYSLRDPLDPVMKFSDYIDGESLLDKDLVAWVTMGHIHIPGTEDVPVLPTNLNQISFTLAPHNYFTHNPSSPSSDYMTIHRYSRDNSKTVRKSQPISTHLKCVPKSLRPFDISINTDL